MSLFREILALRSNVIIVFGGAFMIIFLIKLTSLLPEKYYFSFSSLVGGTAQPFLIDPPGVSGTKFCEILRKNKINVKDLGQEQVNCAAKANPYEHQFTKQQEDIIYSVAFQTDLNARTKLHNTVGTFKLTPMPPDRLKYILENYDTPKSIYESLQQAYGGQIQSQLQNLFVAGMLPAYAALPDQIKEDVLRASQVNTLSADDKQRILAAHEAFITGFSPQSLAQKAAPPIQKSELDEIVKYAYSRKDVVGRIAETYVETYKLKLQDQLKRSFEASGVNLSQDDNKEKVKSIISKEILDTGLANYVVAILVRIVPVLVFGIILGIIFGHVEIFSISLAGAFAAFLLSWPVILLWDTVVQSSWASQKDLFLIFYALYMLSFFFTSRVGALIGAMFRPALPSVMKLGISQEPTADILNAISWRKLAINVVTGLVANVAVYAWNVVIPLSA